MKEEEIESEVQEESIRASRRTLNAIDLYWGCTAVNIDHQGVGITYIHFNLPLQAGLTDRV